LFFVLPLRAGLLMIDLRFYMAVAEYKRRLMSGYNSMPRKEDAFAFLENCRSQEPVVFNIETTNACNQTCPFCPRTTLMSRPVKTMARHLFQHIAVQINPHPAKLWAQWLEFAVQNYKIKPDEQSENAFFLYILPRVVVLHGYGDPLLDPRIADHVGALTNRDVPTYFSCNPANIRLDRIKQVFDNGLSYIKFSIDSVSDTVRGKDIYGRDYLKVLEVLELKERTKAKTQVIVTMIDLGKPDQEEQYGALQEAFKGTGVYIYQKSLDQAWLTNAGKARSIHWSEFCQIPWSSMTIKSDGLAASCEEDYNNDIILGNANSQTLYDIWNGKKYELFRWAHFNLLPGIHCTTNCDMRKIGELL
jgi:wyosine [tRNA(Phe)-imidazoG37] synthetase (radical SAM superfamily)